MAARSLLSVQHYSTTHLPAADRHEAWVNRHWPSLAPIFRTAPLEPFDTRSETLRLGDLSIVFATITAQRWTRDRSMLRSGDPDALLVAITASGQAQGVMGERGFRTASGSVQLTDTTQPSSHESTASRTILISVPRPIATARGFDPMALHGRVLPSIAATMLGPHVLGLRAAAPELTEADGEVAATTFLDMLGLAITTSERRAQPAARGAASALARAAIESNLGEPSLTIAGLCRQLGISRTSLHRLFDDEGGVQAYIRGRRLEAVRRSLLDPQCREPVYAIAERLGFSDAAHLSRLFRARYGQSPSEFRASGGDPQGG